MYSFANFFIEPYIFAKLRWKKSKKRKIFQTNTGEVRMTTDKQAVVGRLVGLWAPRGGGVEANIINI
jgi:hypothetical protein